MSSKIKFLPEGIQCKIGKQVQILPWPKIQGLHYPLWKKNPYIRTHHGEKIFLDSEDKDSASLLVDFYRHWKEKNPQAARKNAFDYAEPPQSLAWLMMTISVLFCLGLSAILFNESRVERQCSLALANNPIVQTAEILKLKKGAQGNYSVDLRFTAQNGELLSGRRFTIKTYPSGNKDPQNFSVIYAADRPQCWVLSETFGQNDINWAKRRYTTIFNFLVAICFTAVGLVGITFSLMRLREQRPHSREILQIFQLEL